VPNFPPRKRQLLGIHTFCKRFLNSEGKPDSAILERWLQNWTATPPAIPLFDGAEPPTALRWARRRGPRDAAPLPDAMLHKLFRNGAIRIWEPSTGQVKRVKTSTILPLGARLLFPQGAFTHSEDREAENELSLRRKSETYCFKSKSTNMSPPTPAAAAAAALLQKSILFQNEDLIAINKPPGLAVQGGSGVKLSVDSLLPLAFPEQFSNKRSSPSSSSLSPSYDHLKLVHRLDREVTGVLLLGKGSDATARLAEAFRRKSLKATGSTTSSNSTSNSASRKEKKSFSAVVQPRVEKVYWAIVIDPSGSGIKLNNVGYLDAPITHYINGGAKDKIASNPTATATTTAAAAITRYKVLLVNRNSGIAWLELEPLTGRKHQLRQHCARELGLPILGDSKYGALRKEPQKSIMEAILSSQKRDTPLFLHCRSIKIDFPGQKKGILVEAQVPETWQKLFNQHGWPLP